MTHPLPSPGTKCKHKGSGQPYVFQGKDTDGWGDYYIMEDDKGKPTAVPYANLNRYEIVKEEKQDVLFAD